MLLVAALFGPATASASANSLTLTLNKTSGNTADPASVTVTASGVSDNAPTSDSATYLQLFSQHPGTACAATAQEENLRNDKAFVGPYEGRALPAGQFSFTDTVAGDESGRLVCGYLTYFPSSGTKQTTTAQAGPVSYYSDTDHDGFLDSQDACPTLAGVASAKGCPDADGDGITDGMDVCPQSPGAAVDDGCRPAAVVMIGAYFRLPRSPKGLFDAATALCIPADTDNHVVRCSEQPAGSITYSVDAATRRKIGLPSTTLASGVFKRTSVGEGEMEAVAGLVFKPGVHKRLKAYYKKPLANGATIKLRMIVTAHLTAPVNETITRTVVLGTPHVFKFVLPSSGIDPKWPPKGSTGV